MSVVHEGRPLIATFTPALTWARRAAKVGGDVTGPQRGTVSLAAGDRGSSGLRCC